MPISLLFTAEKVESSSSPNLPAAYLVPGFLFLHFDSAQGPPSGGRTARYVVHIARDCGGIPTLRGGVGGAAGSSSAASAPPPALHTLIVKRQQLAAFGAGRDPETLNSWCAWAPRCSFPIPKTRGARFTFFLLSSPAGANRPGARGPRAAAPSPPLPLREFSPARSSPSPFPGDAHARQAGSRPLAFPLARENPLPFRLAALSRAAVFSIQPRPRGAPARPPTAGPQLPSYPRFPRSPVGA